MTSRYHPTDDGRIAFVDSTGVVTVMDMEAAKRALAYVSDWAEDPAMSSLRPYLRSWAHDLGTAIGRAS